MAGLSYQDFGTAFKEFLDRVVSQAPVVEPWFVRTLREHCGGEPRELPVVAGRFAAHDHPNLQLAIEEYLRRTGQAGTPKGISGPHRFGGMGMADLLTGGAGPGPADLVELPTGPDAVMACVQLGLFLMNFDGHPVAVLVRGPSEMRNERHVNCEVMSSDRSAATELLAELRALALELSVHRGKAISVSTGRMWEVVVRFERVPEIAESQLVLPARALTRIRRQVEGISRHSAYLTSAGQHVKRGLMLHGPPGTGKTLTAMYLASRSAGRTLVLVTGRDLGAVGTACRLARTLAPSMVVIEDVDLVAEERTRPGAGQNPLLFELLNQMDGIAPDFDIVFLLTTNRFELVEPALAQRPGRIDLRVEVPLPAPDDRRRLFDLYAKTLERDFQDWDDLVLRTEGRSGAFIRELVRRAALISAETDNTGPVTTESFALALEELSE